MNRSARGRVEHDQPEESDPRDHEDQAPRQPGERPRDDGGGDHAWLGGTGGKPLAARHAAVLRAMRTSGGPPMLCSNASSAAMAFCLSNRYVIVSRTIGAATAAPKPPCSMTHPIA